MKYPARICLVLKYLCILVAPYWNDWGVWGPCSASCGEGTKVRTRTCEHPYCWDGTPCPGDPNDEDPCSDNPFGMHLII